MGFFATYCGIIYNDFLAVPLWLFDSCYPLTYLPKKADINDHEAWEHEHQKFSTKQIDDCTYPIGVDPVWHLGKNELTYLNSLKMKLSVIFGVLQMSLGICMKAFNASYHKRNIDFFFEFLPQIILLMVLFGYMDLLIIAKWLTDFSGRESQAPSVISTMIGMALKGGDLEVGQVSVIGDYDTQKGISVACLLIALVAVPMMLFPKPLIINAENKKHQESHHAVHHAVPDNIQLQEQPKPSET